MNPATASADRVPDWRLPRGVSRSVWEFANDHQIARGEEEHLTGTDLTTQDREAVARWFPGKGTVADLGCGTGRLLAEFTSRGWDAVGVDLSHASLCRASERVGAPTPGSGLVRGNLCALDFLASGRFDAALLMFGTLGMISGRENRRGVLRHVHRLLRPKGRLALHVHSIWPHLRIPGGRRWLACDVLRRACGATTAGDTRRNYRGIPAMYHHVFTRGETRRLLASAGFRIVECLAIAPEGGVSGRSQRSVAALLTDFRATGWIILAARQPG